MSGERMVDERGREPSGDPHSSCADDQVALPYARAFVVHFGPETDARLEHAAGRLEHLQTGCRSRFASIEELLTRIRAALAGIDKPADGGQHDV